MKAPDLAKLTVIMKTLSLPYVTNKALKTSRDHESKKYIEAATLLVVFTADGTDQQFRTMNSLRQKFQQDNKRVSFLYLLHKIEDKPSVGLDDNMVMLDKKDIGYFGEIRNEAVNALLKVDFDFMISADLESNIYTDLIIAKSNAKCKVGRYLDAKDKFYDFMIQIDETSNLAFYLDQVYHYTKLF